MITPGGSRKDTEKIGLSYVTVSLKVPGQQESYRANFLVDTGATDTFAPSAELRKIGIKPIGKMSYELADGSLEEYEFGLAEISFMGEITAGRVIFGPDNVEPLLGVTALESVGIIVDPTNRTLKRLPAIPLK
jgi:clan AA aspartic protease